MPRFYRVLCAFFVVALHLSFAPEARAHAPFESSLKIQRTEENLEVSVVLTIEAARLLLPAEKRDALTLATFPSHRDALRSAASSLCTLVDASAAVLPPVRLLVTLNPEGEVYFLVLYPTETRPAGLTMPFLDAQAAGCYCELTDFTAPEPRRATLVKTRAAYDFSPAVSS